MSMLDLIPGVTPIKLAGYALAAAAVVGAVTYGVHLYNEWIREPVRAEVKKRDAIIAEVNAQIDANKATAAKLLAQREAENKLALDAYNLLARNSQNEYEKRIADIRRNADAAGRVRLYYPGAPGCGPGGAGAGQAGKGSTGIPEGTAASGELPAELAGFLVAEAKRADENHAYAESCYAFVNAK